MADWASVGGLRIVSASIAIPWYGTWVADVTLAVPTAIASGMVKLVAGDLTLTGTVVRQLAVAGVTTAKLVGGAGGWQKTLAARAYRLAGGVPLSVVLGDLMSDSGETLGAASATSIAGATIGGFFVRESAVASRTLRQIAGPIWWVDQTGATQVIDRTTVPISGATSDGAHLGAIKSKFATIESFGSKGKFQIATEVLTDWMPGRTFSDANVTVPQTISLVTHVIDGGGSARSEILTS